ncbi:MAG: hypothetical protein ACYCU7_02800 [Acidimicrobiales bacterium]
MPLANAVRQPSPPRVDRLALVQRDASLLRVSSLTRALGAGVVVLVGVVGLYVSRAFPGHQSTSHATGGAPSAAPTAGGATAGGASPSGATAGGTASPGGGISAPASPPVTTPAMPPVVSGAS